jgi:hypothetical protein
MSNGEYIRKRPNTRCQFVHKTKAFRCSCAICGEEGLHQFRDPEMGEFAPLCSDCFLFVIRAERWLFDAGLKQPEMTWATTAR